MTLQHLIGAHADAIRALGDARRAAADADRDRTGYVHSCAIQGIRPHPVRSAQLAEAERLTSQHLRDATEAEVAARATLMAAREKATGEVRPAAIRAAADALHAARLIDQRLAELRQLRERFRQSFGIVRAAAASGINLDPTMGTAPRVSGAYDSLGREIGFAVSGLPDAVAVERLLGRLAAEADGHG